jgi:aryl-alcohol dehydrogenase-like predicted oxidoreductase
MSDLDDTERGAGVSRRNFITRTVAGLATAGALPPLDAGDVVPGGLPTRPLGRSGIGVPILAFGCGSRFLGYGEQASLAVLERALELGVRYLDTAADYGGGESERRVGRLLKQRRSEVFLATKVPMRARTRDLALREVEGSLRRLQTGHVDLLHVHGLEDAADLARVESKDGVLRALYELREQKVARLIGMSSHADGSVLARAIERHDLDCVQMAMNPARANAFEELALPAALAAKLGILLMKATAQEELLGGARAPELLRYAWSLPVAAAVVGMPRREMLEANAEAARRFVPMTAAEMNELRARLAPSRAALEGFFARHRDGKEA